MKTKLGFNSSNTIWIDDTFLKGHTGIAQDARTVVHSLESFFLVKPIPKFFYMSRKNTLLRRISTLVLLLFQTPFKLSSNIMGSYYQPQLSPLFPGKNINSWFIRIHDIFPITNPKWFRKIATKQFEIIWRQAISSDAIFIFSSYYMRDCVTSLYPELINRVEVAHCTPRTFIGYSCGDCAACKLLDSSTMPADYFVSVGTIEPRKNYEFLVRNWFIYREGSSKDDSLLIVGGRGWKSRRMLKTLSKYRNITTESVIWVDSCCDNSLAVLYKNAKSFVSASLDEGFNLPALEARFTFNLPLILSDIPVHRELHSEYAFFFGDSMEFIEALNSFDPEKSRVDSPYTLKTKSVIEIVTKRFQSSSE